MSKKSNHNADIKNPNKGTSGTNKTYDKNQGNRGKQIQQSNKSKKQRRVGGTMPPNYYVLYNMGVY